MTTEKLEQAEGWFKLHDIDCFIDDYTSIYVDAGYGVCVQISNAEIKYRAELYLENLNN